MTSWSWWFWIAWDVLAVWSAIFLGCAWQIYWAERDHDHSHGHR